MHKHSSSLMGKPVLAVAQSLQEDSIFQPSLHSSANAQNNYRSQQKTKKALGAQAPQKIPRTHFTSKQLESRTTDDLLDSPSPGPAHHASSTQLPESKTTAKKPVIGQHVRGRSNLLPEMRSASQLDKPTVSLKGILSSGDYAQQDPVVGAVFSTQFKKTGPGAASRGAISVTKQELATFQKNGQLSKEFIQQNKRELESFIKMKNRSDIDQSLSAIDPSGGNGALQLGPASGLMYGTKDRADGSHIQKQKVEDDMLNAGISKSDLVFPDDTKVEHTMKTVQTKMSPKVIENWINATLVDAEHLDIPSVILKPKNKVPLTKYAIDRNTLASSGLSSDQIDRVYRSLFVHSVGFYELLKQQLSNCSELNQLSILMSLWKVFGVLLEYACRTEYRLLISKVTAQNEVEKQEITERLQQRISEEQAEKRLLNINMKTMDLKMEQLEKERNNERSLRLKLEEEYMTITRNHEEEVSLRLQFEARVNKLNTQFRELEIKHKRVQQQFQHSQADCERLAQVQKQQAEQLVELKTSETDNLSKIETLLNFKTSATKELDKKNNMLRNAEALRKQATDQVDVVKYQVQDQENQSRRQELRMQDLQVTKQALESQIASFEVQVKDMKDLDQIKQKQIDRDRVSYEQLASQYATTNEQLQVLKVTDLDHIRLISKLQQDLESHLMQREDFEMQSVIYKTQRDDLQREHTQLTEEHTTTVDHLQAINKERHMYEDLYNGALKQISQLERDLIDANRTIDKHVLEIEKLTITMGKMHQQIAENAAKTKEVLFDKDSKISELTSVLNTTSLELTEVTNDRDAWRAQYNKQRDDNFEAQGVIAERNATIRQQSDEITGLKDSLQNEVANKYREMERAENALKVIADQKKTLKVFEESTRYLTHKSGQSDKLLRQKIQDLEHTISREREWSQMLIEDTESKFYKLIQLLDLQKDAEKTALENQALADQLQRTQRALKKREKQVQLIETELQAKINENGELQVMTTEVCTSIVTLEENRIQELEKTMQVELKKLQKQNEYLQMTQGQAGSKNSTKTNMGKGMADALRRQVVTEQDHGFQEMLKETKQSNMSKSNKSITDSKKAAAQPRATSQSSLDSMASVKMKANTTSKKSKVSLDSGQQAENLPGLQKEINQTSAQSLNADDKQAKEVRESEMVTERKSGSEILFSAEGIKIVNQTEPQTPVEHADDQELKVQEQVLVQDQTDVKEKEKIESTEQEQIEQDLNEKDESIQPAQQVQETVDEQIDEEDLISAISSIKHQEGSESEVSFAELKQNEVRAIEQRRNRFKEYRSYLNQMSVSILDSVSAKITDYQAEQIDASANTEEQLPFDTAALMQLMFRQFQQLAETPQPDQFKHLRLNDDEKNMIKIDFESELESFQDKFGLFLEQAQSSLQTEEDQEIKSPLLGRQKSMSPQRKQSQIITYSDFARIHSQFIDRLIKENENRIAMEALSRRKIVSLKPETPKDHIQGRQDFQYLIRMTRDPSYYEKHRKQYIEGLQRAAEELQTKEEQEMQRKLKDQAVADQVARVLLERHQAKVARIVVERPYLQNQATTSPTKQIIYNSKPGQDATPGDTVDSREQAFLKTKDEPYLEAFHTGIQSYSQEVSEQDPLSQTQENDLKQMLFTNQQQQNQGVHHLIEKVRQMREQQDALLQADTKGGVAAVHNKIVLNRNNSVVQMPERQKVVGNPSIRKKIKSVVSRQD